MLELEEKKASACKTHKTCCYIPTKSILCLGVQAGGVFVDGEFEQHLTRILNRIDSIDDEERSEYIQKAVKDFESVAKKEFEDAGRPYRVDLGSGKKFKHEEFGISRGVISLEG
jgi:hypothetical protein